MKIVLKPPIPAENQIFPLPPQLPPSRLASDLLLAIELLDDFLHSLTSSVDIILRNMIPDSIIHLPESEVLSKIEKQSQFTTYRKPQQH